MSSDIWINKISDIMDRVADEIEAHRQAAAVLVEMAENEEHVRNVVRHYLESLVWAETRTDDEICFGITVFKNAKFGLNANVWFPAQSPVRAFSAVPIHHHGAVRLTTVAAFGPGYTHWLFAPPNNTPNSEDVYSLFLKENCPHPKLNSIFIEAYHPHVFGYPEQLSITYALWSHTTNHVVDLAPPCFAFVPCASPSVPRASARVPDPGHFERQLLHAIAHLMVKTNNQDLTVALMDKIRGGFVANADCNDPVRLLALLTQVQTFFDSGPYFQSKCADYAVEISHLNAKTDCLCIKS